MRITVATAICLLLSACSTEPVTVIGLNGGNLTGATRTGIYGGPLRLLGSGLSCWGSLSPQDLIWTISTSVLCSNGQRGFIIATRHANVEGAYGTMTMDDGRHAGIVFGEAAQAF